MLRRKDIRRYLPNNVRGHQLFGGLEPTMNQGTEISEKDTQSHQKLTSKSVHPEVTQEHELQPCTSVEQFCCLIKVLTTYRYIFQYRNPTKPKQKLLKELKLCLVLKEVALNTDFCSYSYFSVWIYIVYMLRLTDVGCLWSMLIGWKSANHLHCILSLYFSMLLLLQPHLYPFAQYISVC